MHTYLHTDGDRECIFSSQMLLEKLIIQVHTKCIHSHSREKITIESFRGLKIRTTSICYWGIKTASPPHISSTLSKILLICTER